jgi:hypothetical protein
MTPVKSPTLYIDRKPYFLKAPPIDKNFLLLGSRQGGGESLHTSTKSTEEEGPRGRRPLEPAAAALHRRAPPLLRPGCRLFPLVRHISITIYSRSHHPHCNLLANMMYDAIYSFPMIYCVSMSLFE